MFKKRTNENSEGKCVRHGQFISFVVRLRPEDLGLVQLYVVQSTSLHGTLWVALSHTKVYFIKFESRVLFIRWYDPFITSRKEGEAYFGREKSSISTMMNLMLSFLHICIGFSKSTEIARSPEKRFSLCMK